MWRRNWCYLTLQLHRLHTYWSSYSEVVWPSPWDILLPVALTTSSLLVAWSFMRPVWMGIIFHVWTQRRTLAMDTPGGANGIPTLRAWIFVCRCHPQSQSRWKKTGCWGSYGTGILPKPWKRLSHRCPNQETACKCEAKYEVNNSERKPQGSAWQRRSYKHHRGGSLMEIVEMKPAGSPQEKPPANTTPEGTAGKLPRRVCNP